MLEAQEKKIMYILANSAEAAPPLGTVLGNLGVNTVKFCDSFNNYTSKLPSYIELRVEILIYDNRSTSFSVDLPSVGYILNLLKFEKFIKVKVFDRINEVAIWCIRLYQVLKLCKFRLPYLSINESFPIIFGTVKSKGLLIVKE